MNNLLNENSSKCNWIKKETEIGVHYDYRFSENDVLKLVKRNGMTHWIPVICHDIDCFVIKEIEACEDINELVTKMDVWFESNSELIMNHQSFN